MKYRKKPVIAKDDGSIEAVQYVGGADNIIHIIKTLYIPESRFDILQDKLRIHNLEGHLVASFGDWIIKGVKGEVYLIKPDIFEMTYEKVDES